MKRALLILTAVVAVAFGLTAMLKHRVADTGVIQSGSDHAEKQRIRNFWSLYHEANEHRSQGNFAAAVPLYRECLRANPRHEDSLYYLATSLQELGQYTEAAETFGKLIELNPASSRARSQLGNTLALLAPGAPADLTAARKAFEGSIEINREEAGPFLRLGQLDLNQGRLEAAREHFQVAAGFGSPEGNFWLGYTLFRQGRNQEASRFLRRALDTYIRERKVAARGVLSEGDVLPAPGKPLTALERTALKSMLLLYWVGQRSGGYPEGFPNEFRLHLSSNSSLLEPRGAATRESLPPRWVTAKPSLLGGRGAWGDYDGDGRPDLVVAGQGRELRLFRNQGGNFSEITAAANLTGIRDVWDAYWVDYDGDRFLDLYLIRSGFLGTGRNHLYRNLGHGKFANVTAAAGLEGERATARAVFADFDGDGLVDLVEVGARTERSGSVRLYRNTGRGFVEQTSQAGFAARATAVDCALGDYDRDGRPDLFVLYWKSPAVLYRNLGNGRFLDATASAGLSKLGGQGFSTLFFDYDNDDRLDLVVTAHAPYEEAVRSLLQPQGKASRNTPRVFRNQGNGSFQEVTERVGLTKAYGTMQALAADFDGDGWKDLLLVNGGLDAARLEPSVILRNDQGRAFHEWPYLPGYDAPANSLGAAVADANGDGTPDIYLSQNLVLRPAFGAGGLYFNPTGRKAREQLALRVSPAK
jgi:tetratricopeptide (TPR) repeat protein